MDGYDSLDFPDQDDWGGECGADYGTDPQQHPAAPTGRPAVPYIAEHYNYLESLFFRLSPLLNRAHQCQPPLTRGEAGLHLDDPQLLLTHGTPLLPAGRGDRRD